MAAAAFVRCALACAGAVVLLEPIAWATQRWPSAGAPLDGGATLHIRLTTATDLPPGVRSALVREVEEIWQREGVTLNWLDPAVAAPEGQSVIRVLMAHGVGVPVGPSKHTWPVAEVLEDQSGQPVAIASVDGALRVLRASGCGTEPDALMARRLGVVLGRAIAHEIGHYVLNTPVHARHGLMRATINAREFADLRRGGFVLGADEGIWARTSLSRGSADELRLAPFVYRH